MSITITEKPRALVVISDNQPQTRSLVDNNLVMAGYDVILSRDFSDASRILIRGTPIDLIVIDGDLGERTTSSDLAFFAGCLEPDTPRILLAGSSEPVGTSEYATVIRKPFTGAQLTVAASRLILNNEKFMARA